MKKYKLLGEDDSVFKIQHPDGSEFHVAKNAIPESLHKKIKGLEPIKMADGGEVPDFDKIESSSSEDSSAIPDYSNPMGEKQNFVNYYQNLGAGGLGGSPESRAESDYNQLQDLRRQDPNSLSNLDAGRLKELEGIAGSQPAQPREPAGIPSAQPSAQPVANPVPSSQPVVPSVPSQQVGAPQPVAGNQPYNPLDLNSQYAVQNKVLDAEQNAIKSSFAAKQNEYNLQAKQESDYAQQIAKVEENLQKTTAPWRADNDLLYQSIRDHKLDPNRLWNNMNTGNKVLAAISVALSGIGSGLSGKPNMAMDVIDNAIDKDIQAQRLDLGKKETLFSENLRRIGDANAAAAVTKAQLLTSTQAMIHSSNARIATADSARESALASAQIDLKRQELMRDAALRKMIMDQGGGTNPDQLISYLRQADPAKAKEIEGRYIPNVGIASVPVSDKVREELSSRQSLQEQIGNLRQWAQTHGGTVDPKDVAYGKALASSVQDAYRRANGQGVFREAEADFVKGIVAEDPTAFFNKLRVDPKYKALEDSNLIQLNGLKKSYGLPQQAPAPEIKTVNGVRYKRGPKGEAIPI